MLVDWDIIVQNEDAGGGSIVEGVRDRNNDTHITIDSGQSEMETNKIVGICNATSSHKLDGSNTYQLPIDCILIIQDEDGGGGSIVDGARDRNNDIDITTDSSQSEPATNKIVGVADNTSSNSSKHNLKDLHKQVKKLPSIKHPTSTQSEVCKSIILIENHDL